MANVMKVDVVDSESQIFSGEVEYLIAPAIEGEIGIYPHHIPLITKLNPGVLRLQIPDTAAHEVLAISGGFLEVQGNHVTILADIVERTEPLDEARLLEQKSMALARIKRADSTMTADVATAQASLEIAIAQLKALDYLKKFNNRA
jgi:F-type H+-transporting ATPase subunit epsilon